MELARLKKWVVAYEGMETVYDKKREEKSFKISWRKVRDKKSIENTILPENRMSIEKPLETQE